MPVLPPSHLLQRCPEVVASSNPLWSTGKEGGSSWMHTWMLPSTNVMINLFAILYVKSSQFNSVRVTAGISDRLCRLYVSQEEDTAAVSARTLHKPLFPDRHCDKAAEAPQRNVKALSRRRNKGKSNRGEKPSHLPDLPVESLSISAKGKNRWTRPSQSCQSTERALQVDPDPQWNTGKMRGSTRKRTVSPSRASPDVDDTSPEQSSDGNLKVRRAKRSNRQHRKRVEDSPQQHLEERRTEVRKKGRAEKDENKKISKPTNIKPSTSSKKTKIHKGSAQIRAEEDGNKWTEEELALLQECVWFPDQTAQCPLTELDSSVCVCLIQGSGALSKTQGQLLGKGGEDCGNTLCRRLL